MRNPQPRRLPIFTCCYRRHLYIYSSHAPMHYAQIRGPGVPFTPPQPGGAWMGGRVVARFDAAARASAWVIRRRVGTRIAPAAFAFASV
jgi:hypothetical protein